MADSRTSSSPVAAVGCLIVVLFLPVIYVLSLGPAVWLVNHGLLSEDVATAIYFPILFAAEKFDWVEVVLGPWIQLFE